MHVLFQSHTAGTERISMFQVTPYPAQRQVHQINGAMKWTTCRVVGIDARDLKPKYIVEVAEAGEFLLTTVDLIRKSP